MGFLPLPPRPDPWAAFMSAFMQGQQLKQQREVQEQRFMSEQEERKLRQDELKLRLSALKLEGAHREKQFEQEKAKTLFDMIGMSPGPQLPTQIPMPEMAPQGSMAGMIPPAQPAPMEGPMGMPALSVPMEMPGYGQIQAPTMEGKQQINLQQTLQKLLMEAQGAGLKTAAEQKAMAPYKADERADTQEFDLEKLKITEGGADRRAGLSRSATLGAARISADATLANRKIEREGKLLDDYRAETKEFAVVDDQMGRMREFAKLETGPADIGMIYSYMKMLDPTSAVREGEYATAENTSGVPDRVRIMYNKALKGDRLSPKQRAEFLAAGETNYESLQGRRKGIEKKYKQTANRWGLDPSILSQPETPGGGGPAVGERRMINGQLAQWDGQGWLPAK